MSETRCAACDASMEPRETSAVRLVTAGSVTAGGSAPRELCPRCEDDVQHLHALFYGSDGFGFCGCGCPGDAYALVRDILALAPFYEGWQTGKANHAKVADLLGGSDGAFYLVLYMIDRSGLIEHGGSIGGSWLTAKGKHYLPLMRAHEWDDLDEAGSPHDGDECPASCRHWIASHDEWQRKEILWARAQKDPDPREPVPSDDPRCHCSRKPHTGWNVTVVNGRPTMTATAPIGGEDQQVELWLHLDCPHHGGIVRQLSKRPA